LQNIEEQNCKTGSCIYIPRQKYAEIDQIFTSSSNRNLAHRNMTGLLVLCKRVTVNNVL